jgi:Sec-independent protein secretion pathway component TatC
MILIDQWATVLKHSATTWVTLIVNTLVANALVFLAVLPFAPLYVQLPLAILIALVASSPTWFARIVSQPKMVAKVEEKSSGQ